MEFQLLMRGDRACFRRPEFVADVVSYDVITPMAVRGVFETIHAAPDIRWRIDEIRVLNRVRSTWMALNEVGAAAPGGPLPVRIAGPADRRMACVLSDVAYLLTAHIERIAGTASRDAQEARFRDRAASGRFLRPPFLGLNGFAAEVVALAPEAVPPASALADSGAIDLGWMVYDRERAGEGPRFFRARMIDGVIDLRHRDALILAR